MAIGMNACGFIFTLNMMVIIVNISFYLSVDPAFSAQCSNALPTRWRARFLFEKLIFIDYLKMTWSRHLFLFYF